MHFNCCNLGFFLSISAFTAICIFLLTFGCRQGTSEGRDENGKMDVLQDKVPGKELRTRLGLDDGTGCDGMGMFCQKKTMIG